jgi:hypothetical protein
MNEKINEYPSIIMTSNDKNIRFGCVPIRADMQGLKLEGKIPFKETTRLSSSRPAPFFEKQFSDIFYKIIQMKTNLFALAFGGGQNAYLSAPTSLAEAMFATSEVDTCSNYISDKSKELTTFSDRTFKSIVYLKEAYLNVNKKSVILGERVLIRDKFLIDDKTKNITKKIYLNGIIEEDFNKNIGSDKSTFIPTNNHMVAGGPVFSTTLGTINETNITAHLNSIEKMFKEDLKKLENNPALDKNDISKREQYIKDYKINLEKNLRLSRATNFMKLDFSDFIISPIRSKAPYYQGKKASVLAENIKYIKNSTAYWPVLTAVIGNARTNTGGYMAAPGGVLFQNVFVRLFTQPLGRPECFFPFQDNYLIANGEASTTYEEKYAPTPVYSTKSVVAGYTVGKSKTV